jgi:hydrogenase maturation protease
MESWGELSRPAPRSVEVAGVEVGRGSRVVLRPGAGGDVFDQAVAGQIATVEGIHQDLEGKVQLSVTLEDDPGRDLGEQRQPGHRFFFSPGEVEPLARSEPLPARRILVAGIGNIFLGDDGFGVEVAQRLARRPQPPGVEVKDFGVRGMDLMYALGESYDAAVFVDAVPRGAAPGTLFVIEPELDQDDAPMALDAHGMDPVKVLALARQLGGVPDRVLVVGCEPEVIMSGDEEEIVGGLSEPVQAALDGAVELVEELVGELVQPAGNESEKERTA